MNNDDVIDPREAMLVVDAARKRLDHLAEHMTEHAYQEMASALEHYGSRETPVVRWKRLFERAQIPAYATDGAAGFDLRAIDVHELRPGSVVRVGLGLAAEIPPGYEIQIRPRSGLALNENVYVILGTIDSDYRGEIGVLMTSSSTYWVRPGDRIAQGVLARVERASHVEVEEFSDTRRGAGGFGSTGR